jgi:hypothetical protein
MSHKILKIYVIDQTTRINNPEDKKFHTKNLPDEGGSMTSETLVNIDQTT